MNERGPPGGPPIPLQDALVMAERHRMEGRLLESEAVCRQILVAHPNQPHAEHLLGLLAHQNGKLGAAIECVRRAIKIAPDVALFRANLAEMLRLAGQPRQGAEEARRAIALEPGMAAAWSNLGAIVYELKDYEEAARAHRKAIEVDPDFAPAHCSLGNALHKLKRFDEAVLTYRRAIELAPQFADAWANLGTTLQLAGSFDESVAALRRAISLAPGHANARSGLGIVLLMRGDLAEGWDEYEWRLHSSDRKGPRFPERPWQGESLAGRHIYVEAEQGFGDTLQFARYIPHLLARGARVSFRVHQQLAPLMRESLVGADILGDRGDPGPYDCDALLLSLPRLFRTRLETIPAQVPYLRPPAEAATRWRKRLSGLSGMKIGLVWAGNPEHANDMRRSLDLTMLAPILKTPGTSFVSLQVGPRADDLKKRNADDVAIEDLSGELTDFTETAAAVSALDLVITVDTAPAHLVGALDKPAWLLLPWVTDWRWMLGREDSPWYPTMRLYRQRRGESWDPALLRLAADLAAVARGDAARLMPFKQDGERRAAVAAEIMATEHARPAAPAGAAITPGQALMLAEQNLRAGFLADAEELIKQAIATEPDNAEAVHMLGIIAHQSGKLVQAIEHVRRAISIRPDVPVFHANLGEMCRLAGRIDEALEAGRRALALNSNYPEALNNVGIALFERDAFDDAVAHYDRALALWPDYLQAHSNRGNALQRLKRFAEAEACYRHVLELAPQFADAWNNLGTCLRELKRLEEAEQVYRRALELQPNNPETLDNLALAVKDLNRPDEAAKLLQRALSIEQRSDKIHLHYGAVLVEQKRLDEAADAAERALALNPNNHDTFNLMGRVAFERGDLPEALKHYESALALKPGLADAHNNKGNVLKELGRLDEARRAFLKSIELDPMSAGVYVNIADAKSFTADDPLLKQMETLAAKADGLSRNDRMHLDFALGKAYADFKDYRHSFTHFLAGNAAKRATVAYDETAALGLFERIEEAFTAELISGKTGQGDPSARPIFIIGMPRSGTTLIEQILASHPLVHGAGELDVFDKVVLTARAPDGTSIAYPEFVQALEPVSLRAIGASYLERVAAIAPIGERVTDKMPSNYYFAGLIHLALPNAVIIHAMRDPVDTCISCFSKLFTAEQNHTYDLTELGRYYKRYEGLMQHWRRVLPAGRMLEVQYEEVVGDLETQARRILAHCALPWDARCLAFHRTDRPVRTASASQVRQPIYNSAVGRWRGYEEFLTPLLKELGI